MKTSVKLGIFVGLPVVGLLGYLLLAHLSGGAWPTPGLPLGGDAGLLRRSTTSFWEDIQFKDFDHAATYHAPDTQAQVDIPYLLERLFLEKPEQLDVMSYEIVMVDIDSTGLRARVKSRIKVKDLLRGEVMEKEMMLYWKRATEADPWYMDLETSLRTLDADDSKKH
jgi:hypothetical protein